MMSGGKVVCGGVFLLIDGDGVAFGGAVRDGGGGIVLGMDPLADDGEDGGGGGGTLAVSVR